MWVNGDCFIYIVCCYYELAIVVDVDIVGCKIVGRLLVEVSEFVFWVYFVVVNVVIVVGFFGYQFVGGVEYVCGGIDCQVGRVFNIGSGVSMGKKVVFVWSEGVNFGCFVIYVFQFLSVGVNYQYVGRGGFSSGGLIR